MPTQETRKITGQKESALDVFYKVALTKKALIEAIGAGVQQVTNFAEIRSVFDRPLDECVFIKPEINSDNPNNLIPIVFVYSHPDIAGARQISVDSDYNILQIQHENLPGIKRIRMTTSGLYFYGNVKYISSLEFRKTPYNYDMLEIIIDIRRTKSTVSALGILVEQSGDELKYHPFTVKLPDNYAEVVKNDGQMMSNQELRDMRSKIEAMQAASAPQVVAQEANPGDDGVSRRSRILVPAPTKTEASLRARTNKLSVSELRGQIANLQAQINEFRRDNTGRGTKDKIKALNKEIERIKNQIEHKTHPGNNRGYNSF